VCNSSIDLPVGFRTFETLDDIAPATTKTAMRKSKFRDGQMVKIETSVVVSLTLVAKIAGDLVRAG
jgi:hypothetical protein